MSNSGMVKKNIFAILVHCIKQDIVLIIALIAALFSMIFIPPSMQYASYIDWKVLACLFCLMAVVAGLRSSGIFDIAAKAVTRFSSNTRTVAFILLGLTFFLSMAITNDVALITLVPFSLLVLKELDDCITRIQIITLQTIAANIGSSLTPVGNPQNLYLFSHYDMTSAFFFSSIGPIVAIGGALLGLSLFFIKKTPIASRQVSANYQPKMAQIVTYLVLFVLSVFAVFRIFDYRVITLIVIIVIAIIDRKIFRRIDYSLLMTFIGFFILIGNLQKIDTIRNALAVIAEKNIVLISALASQFISNVPSAILFSHFSENPGGLLRGVSIGGMGSIIASLASVISFKFYASEYRESSLQYLGVFTLWNIVFFAVLMISNMIIY